MKATVTLIVPCYNEEESLPIFYNAVCDVARQLPDYGISLLLVNDGSKDGTLKVMRELAARDERVQISFLLAELRKGSRHVRRILQREGRLCGRHGRRHAGSAVPAAGNAPNFGSRRIRQRGHPPRYPRRRAADPLFLRADVLQTDQSHFRGGYCGRRAAIFA